MKRKVKALLALALTLAMVSTTLGDSWLYVSAESSTETEASADEPEIAVEEKTEEEPAETVEEAPPVETQAEAEPVSEETEPAQEAETPAAEEQKEETPAPAEEPIEKAPTPAEEPEKAAEEAQPAEETPAEQPTEENAPAADAEQSKDTAAPAASEETPAAETKTAEEENAVKAPETEAPAENKAPEASAEENKAAMEAAPADDAEESSLTEQSIEASVDTEEDNVVITLTGEMPEGVTAKACPAEVSMDGVNIITAYDITIYDADGQEFQPSEEKPIQVKIEDDAVRKALEENAELEVYHLKDAEAEPEQVQDVNLEPAAVEFQAESFSIYVVVEPEEHHTHTYQFLDEDGELINEQILSEGEVLKEPESPGKVHKKFIGWFDENGKVFEAFDDEEGTLAESITTVLKAKYETVYYVFYKAGSTEDSKVLYTQTYHKGDDKIVTDGVPFAAPSGMALIGWSATPNAKTPDQDLKLEGDDVVLYPVVAEAHWITYDTQGGTILEPTYVLANNETKEPTEPTKTGYVFAGWFTDAACTAEFTFGGLLDKDIKLYAKWTPGKAKYTVIHWWENADDDGYSYYESEQLMGTTEAYTNAVGKQYPVTGKDIFGQEITSTDVFKVTTIQQEKIKGDGSTIVNVYYKRAEYTLSFYRNSTDKTPLKTITKKYGQKISITEWYRYWNWEITSNKTGNSSWVIREERDRVKCLAYSSTMPMNGGKLWMNSTGRWEQSASYLVEGLNGENEIHHEDSAYSNSRLTIGQEDAYEITGFEFKNVQNGNMSYDFEQIATKPYGGMAYNGAKFYYTRNKYNIVYHNGEKIDAEVKRPFEADITADGSYEPKTRPEGVDSDYEFAGWYQDPEGTMRYDFTGKTMPANNIIVYAKWKAPEYTVSFNLNGAVSSSEEYNPQTVEKRKLATKPADPTRDGYTFAGWTKDGSPFSFQTQITGDTTLTAQWISNKQYPLTYVYVFKDKKGATKADGESYAIGAEAKVIDVPEGNAWKTPDSMKAFLCWNTEADGSGKDYYPGDSFEMPEDVTKEGAFLYTKWVPKRETTLEYKLNYEGADSYGTYVITVPNKSYSIGSDINNDPAHKNPTRSGYKFLGWSTNPNPAAGEKLLQIGSSIQVDTIDATNNVLYAQWQKLKVVSLNITKRVRGGFGNVNEPFDFEYTITGTGATEKPEPFSLKSGESKLLENIPEGATVTITEKEAKGYTTSYQIGTGAETSGSSCSYAVTDQAEDGSKIEVTFFNQKDGVAPTGVTTDWLSSVLMLFAGFGMAVMMLFTGKRRKI